jgi:hypothetical protein
MALDPVHWPDAKPTRRGAEAPRLGLIELEPEVPRKRGLDRVRCPGRTCGCVSEGAFCDDTCRASNGDEPVCGCGHDTCRVTVGRL